MQEDLRPLSSRRRPIRRPLWLVGFTIYITSNVFSTVFQLDALPIVILAPLGAVSLIFNALLAKVLLGDHFGASSVIGTGLVTVGAVLIAVFGVVQEKEHSLDDLLDLWSRPAFLAFFSIVAAGVVILLVAVSRCLSSWDSELTYLGPHCCMARQETTSTRAHIPTWLRDPADNITAFQLCLST